MQQSLQHLLASNDGRLSRLEVLEGPTGRRQWCDEVKARIVAESFEPGVRVSAVARRHRMSPQQLTTWRRQAREGRLVLPDPDPGFATMILETRGEMTTLASAMIEVEASGVIVRLPADFSAARIGEIAARLRTP